MIPNILMKTKLIKLTNLVSNYPPNTFENENT